MWRQDRAEKVWAVRAHQLSGVIGQHVHHGAGLHGPPGPQRTRCVHTRVLGHFRARERGGGRREPSARGWVYGNMHHNRLQVRPREELRRPKWSKYRKSVVVNTENSSVTVYFAFQCRTKDAEALKCARVSHWLQQKTKNRKHTYTHTHIRAHTLSCCTIEEILNCFNYASQSIWNCYFKCTY